MSCPRHDLQPRAGDRVRDLAMMRPAGDAVLLAPDQQRRYRDLAEPRAAVDARHDRALLRSEGVGAGVRCPSPGHAAPSHVAALPFGEEARDALLDDLDAAAAFHEREVPRPPPA